MASSLEVPPTLPGTVTQASPLLVQLPGADTPAPALKDASYTPTVGDQVYVVRFKTGLLVPGKVG